MDEDERQAFDNNRAWFWFGVAIASAFWLLGVAIWLFVIHADIHEALEHLRAISP